MQVSFAAAQEFRMGPCAAEIRRVNGYTVYVGGTSLAQKVPAVYTSNRWKGHCLSFDCLTACKAISLHRRKARTILHRMKHPMPDQHCNFKTINNYIGFINKSRYRLQRGSGGSRFNVQALSLNMPRLLQVTNSFLYSLGIEQIS